MSRLSDAKCFTTEQVIEILERQQYRCARCNAYKPLELHHRKARAHLGWDDLASPGGGVANGVGLCRACHRDVHDHRDNTEQFRLQSWETIE